MMYMHTYTHGIRTCTHTYKHTHTHTQCKQHPKKHANPGTVILNYFVILLAVFHTGKIQPNNSVFFIVLGVFLFRGLSEFAMRKIIFKNEFVTCGYCIWVHHKIDVK